MTTPLYRKDVLTARNRSLRGEVILHGHLPSLIVTVLLLCAAGLAAAVLFFGRVETANGAVSLLHWLIARGR